MAKRPAARRAARSARGSKPTSPASAGRSAKRPRARAKTTKTSAKHGVAAKPRRRTAAPRPATTRRAAPAAKVKSNRAAKGTKGKVPRLDRARRTLDDTVPTPPSSLDMDRHGSAARTGRAEMNDNLFEHRNMTPEITAGDVDVNIEDAYFTGEEAPGGDNPTPDQDIVDDIGKALGVEYQDAEELKSGDKLVERDKHRWELDPASSEDYKDRK
jgi:hypothetical protein